MCESIKLHSTEVTCKYTLSPPDNGNENFKDYDFIVRFTTDLPETINSDAEAADKFKVMCAEALAAMSILNPEICFISYVMDGSSRKSNWFSFIKIEIKS